MFCNIGFFPQRGLLHSTCAGFSVLTIQGARPLSLGREDWKFCTTLVWKSCWVKSSCHDLNRLLWLLVEGEVKPMGIFFFRPTRGLFQFHGTAQISHARRGMSTLPISTSYVQTQSAKKFQEAISKKVNFNQLPLVERGPQDSVFSISNMLTVVQTIM